jgi:hypothetical protein
MGILIDCFIVRHPDARDPSRMPSGPGYPLQVRATRTQPLAGFSLLSLADASTSFILTQ